MIYVNANIITVNEKFDVIENGAIAVKDDRIVAIGPVDQVVSDFQEEAQCDLKGQIVMPGLISLHVHLAQSLLRTAADDLALIEWLCDRIWRMQGCFTEEDGYVASRLTIAEMLKSGTTTFVESLFAERYGFEGAVKAVTESGIRGCLGKVVMDQPRYATQEGITMHPGLVEDERSLSNAVNCFKKYNGTGDGRVEVWFGARTPGGVSEELYREMVKIARENDIGVTMHCAEVKADREFFASKGHSPMSYCKDLGLLAPRTVLAHMVHLDDTDIAILKGTGASVAHCPTSNAKLGSGIARVKELLEADIPVGLGCDGCPCNNVMDLLQEMKLASILPKALHGDPLLVPAKEVIRMSTIIAAKALGKDHEIGSLEVGKKADFITINLTDKLYAQPMRDPVSMVVYIATGADVDTVVINGKVVVKERSLLTMDEKEIIKDANIHGEEVRKRANC
ncbi:putative 5-methylthioadenosine S-adenosylhomocysteine deaminase [Clavispora lusitaniae]|uniref:5-methylthioadenosine S-adenosylhomocysteine deaminase n=1 Tax=Clavispora lusitaniae TaxID=36911 RepID=A0ACD0WLC4_CLALS|nr:putative 5-methylthioadenosine S-adenosylhomocysteine deaminase [Clavispora lusitaniae]QFZ33700.1 putative 5-methylthioadenosine S-adenosylhomocysteine deaminase [Clavispora lusitaniae]QFZ39371.1 putative 5-methylthioadenosine S-adenosylhomocysteine deaminase [Clavispora lusitaniae]QFZ45053.1 putative 5-methylthioadenosine S-adenosylhomocysteine deaminase [Clavispora lusitaniae]QFZ50730.1 putative 5-methylthioadenosine S-adenosylhomocysteine deaminase [Clavispora lusitaniae]